MPKKKKGKLKQNVFKKCFKSKATLFTSLTILYEKKKRKDQLLTR